MKVVDFIKRPVLSSVISVGIVLLGLIALATLPVEQYPDIAPPTIRVSASYTGASAEAVQKSVAVPLEESINGVENMTYMTSEVTDGSASITVYFEQGTDPDMAAVNVQNRVSKAQGQLPSEVTKIGVQTTKRQTNMLIIGSLYSPDNSYDENFIGNYLSINIEPQLKRIQGVGDVMCLSNSYSMRIWIKPDVMAQYGLNPSDVITALNEQNIEAPTGSFGENSDNAFQYTLRYKGRLESVEEFENIVIRSDNDGNVLRVKDVADVELGAQSYSYHGEMNGHPGNQFMVFQVAGSNATEVIKDIEQLLDNIRKDLPAGLDIEILRNSNDFLFASIHEVIKTLLEAILLVILVVYFFLQDFRSTLIPTISMIVALVGTFACMQVLGFSLNILTLFALVLAIGTVVDDAIVVVEAVQTKFEDGIKSPFNATVSAMHDVSAAIVTTTAVFMAVFIPVSFMGGTAGIFYKQFGLTMAVAVGISAINALTLSPALCAILLSPAKTDRVNKTFADRVRAAYNASYGAVFKKYEKIAHFFIRHKKSSLVIIACAMGIFVYLMQNTKTGLVPDEDTGTMFLSVEAAPGTSLNETVKIMKEAESIVKQYSEVESYSLVTGYSMTSGQGSNYGSLIIKLKDWSEREGKEHSSEAVISRMTKDMKALKNASSIVMAPGLIPGYGSGNAVELYLQDKTGGKTEDFYNNTRDFINTLNSRPEVLVAMSSFNVNYPQYSVNLDAAKCKRAGISPKTVLDVLGSYLGGSYVSDFNRFSKVYRVIVQAPAEYRLDKASLDDIYVINGDDMAPLSQFVEVERTFGAPTLSRFNLFNSIGVNVMMAEGYSSGEVIAAIDEVADQTLPSGYGYEYGGISREEAASSGSNSLIIWGICIVFIYLILCGLYESYFVPLAVILSVPCGLMGSFLFAKMFGVENNIYLQTGVIMLIGLLSKTAILLTEYASMRRANGMSIEDAAFDAAKVRLRPILMTALTMIFGLLPLLFSTGAGANGNRALGVGVIGGMIIGTLALLFLVPSLFIIFKKLEEKFFRRKNYEAEEAEMAKLNK